MLPFRHLRFFDVAAEGCTLLPTPNFFGIIQKGAHLVWRPAVINRFFLPEGFLELILLSSFELQFCQVVIVPLRR
jgi:hypothetical protein